MPSKRRRSRRLRKQLRVGEFLELGFELSLQLRPGLTTHEDDAFWDSFIVECIERLGLSFGGAETGQVTRAGRGSVSPDDLQAVGEWLAQRTEVSAYELGPLDDVWYPAATPG